MIVKNCEWISKDSKEAILTIGDNNFECVAFSHPCNMRVGDRLRTPLLAIFVNEITAQENDAMQKVNKLDNAFSYEFSAKLIDRKNKLVSIGEIIIELDSNLPGDIESGSMISFSCRRLDVIF